VTLGALAAALLACLAAPLLALSWTRQPFPGFLMEPTLVVTGSGDATWAGKQAGIDYPQRVRRINGVAVANRNDVGSLLDYASVGQSVAVQVALPDGGTRLYPDVQLRAFTVADTVRFFWVPYLIGVVYLAIGSWMYRLRGGSLPGRAFSFFCFNLALVCILLFDLSTTHAGTALWTAGIAMSGGALISLALRFPEEAQAVRRRPWLLALPYAVSLALAVWGAGALHDLLHPWAYIDAWGTSYRYAALGIAAFLASTLWRAVRSGSPAVRQQARIVLLGSALSFIPVTFWFIAPLLGMPMSFDAAVFLPSLLIFPATVALAIVRYRLLQVEVIFNRTIFYGVLTALLAGVFSALISMMQRLFVALTGEKSDTAIILTTLLIVATVDVIRKRLQQLVDRQFKEAPDTTRPLKRFGEQARAVALLADETHMARSLLNETVACLHAQSGALMLGDNGQQQIVHSAGRWTGEARMCVPLACDGQRYGWLLVGPRHDWTAYTQAECAVAGQVAADVARAMRLARALSALPAPASSGSPA